MTATGLAILGAVIAVLAWAMYGGIRGGRPPRREQWVDGGEVPFGGHVEHRGGVQWWQAPPPRRRHRCRAQTRGTVAGLDIERCRCGATRLEGDWPWFERNQRRKRKA